MRLWRSAFRRLLRRPASFVSLLLIAGILALVYLAIGATFGTSGDPQADLAAQLLLRFPGAYTGVIASLLSFGSLFAVLYGAAIGGSEWSWGTLKNAIARGESRTLYTLAQAAAVIVVVGLGMVLLFVIGVLLAIVAATLAGLPLDGLGDGATLGRVPEQLARGWLSLAMSSAVGFAIATVAKSQLAGIAIGVVLSVGEPLARIFLPDIIQWFPFAAAGSLVSGLGGAGGGGGFLGGLEEGVAALVVTGWLLVSLAIASLVTERAEIGG